MGKGDLVGPEPGVNLPVFPEGHAGYAVGSGGSSPFLWTPLASGEAHGYLFK